MQHYGAAHSSPRMQIQALLLQKGQRASMGDLKGAREIDLAIRKIMMDADLPFEIDATKITLHGATRAALARASKKRGALLIANGVPDWFRPGYPARLRTALWLRLRPSFRERLTRRYNAGLLTVYYPSPSFWAKLIKPSDFMARQAAEPGAVEAAVAAAQKTVTATDPQAMPVQPEEMIAAMDSTDANAAAVADLEQELMAEDEEEAELAATLATEPDAVLADKAPWYEDNRKVLYAALGGLILFSVLRK